jgi:hypothetical protein
MMSLKAHPSSAPGPVRHLEGSAVRTGDGLLRLAWRLDSDLAGLRLPAVAGPARTDELWRHTCFEAFIGKAGSPAYCELNFSPSGQWAAYAFDGYRSGMTAAALEAVPEMQWRRTPGSLALDVALPLGGLGLLDPPARECLQIGLAAVIEEQSGTMTYWALGHPGGQPDFHDRAGFVLELAGTGGGTDG